MDGDDIAGGVDLLGGLHPLDMTVQIPGRLHGDVGVTAVDLHAQLSCPVGQGAADVAQTDDAQLLARNLMTGKPGLTLFHLLGNVGVILDGLHPVDAADDVPAAQQHTAQGQLHDAAGVSAGGVEDHDALVGAGGQGNVVDAGPGPGHRQQILRQLHVVHIGAAKDDAVGGFHIVRQGEILRPQSSALLGDLIQIMNLEHFISFLTLFSRNSP